MKKTILSFFLCLILAAASTVTAYGSNQAAESSAATESTDSANIINGAGLTESGSPDDSAASGAAGNSDASGPVSVPAGNSDASGPVSVPAKNSDTSGPSSVPAGDSDASAPVSVPAAEENLLGTESQALVSGKTYVIRCAAQPAYVLDISNGGTDNFSNLQIYGYNGTYAQFFTAELNSDGYYTFYNANSDKVIDCTGGSTDNWTNIAQYASNRTGAQQWKLRQNNDGSYTLLNRNDENKALDIYCGAFANGQNVQLYSSNGSAAQKFVFEEADLPDFTGRYVFCPENAPGMALSVAGGSNNSSANIQLEEADSGDSQIFEIRAAWGVYYQLVNLSSGKVLDCTAGQSSDGTNIQQYESNMTNAQLFFPIKNADGSWTFSSRLRRTAVLDVAGAGKSAGTNIQLYTANRSAAQKFRLLAPVKNEILENGCQIRSALNTDRVLNVAGGSQSDFANLESNDANGSDSEKFVLEAVPVSGYEDNYYYRINTFSGKVIDVLTANPANHTNVQQYTWNGTKAQLWHPVVNDDGSYTFHSALDENEVLDLQDYSEDYGGNIQIFQYNGGSTQRWYLTTMQISSCRISEGDHHSVTIKGSGIPKTVLDKKIYLFAVSPYDDTVDGYEPVASADMAESFEMTVPLNLNSSSSLLQKKFYVAYLESGAYHIMSGGYYIENPEAAAANTAAFPSAATKKGLKRGVSDTEIAHALDLKCSSVAIDLPLENFCGNSGSGYTYEGTTYYFNTSRIEYYRNQFIKYNQHGIQITAIIFLSDSSLTDLILPTALHGSNKSSAILYAMNSENAGRKKLEALFSLMASRWTTDGCCVSNWVLGNEVDHYDVYHYSGDISYSRYHEFLADEYRMFNAAVKSEWSNARCYICFDHNWNLGWNLDGWYKGLQLTADFNSDLVHQGGVHWDISMHPYPSPEQDCRFWYRNSTVTDSGTSEQITMLNARYFAAYIKNTYGSATHIIMSETGLSSKYNGTDIQYQQAASVALAYYLAEFDSNIDEIDIHRVADDRSETDEGWYLGLYTWGYAAEKLSVNVFRYMDTTSWSGQTSSYLVYANIKSWGDLVPGFNGNKFTKN